MKDFTRNLRQYEELSGVECLNTGDGSLCLTKKAAVTETVSAACLFFIGNFDKTCLRKRFADENVSPFFCTVMA